MSFQMVAEETILVDDLTCSESEFQRVGTTTEKTRVPAWVLTLGTDKKWKPDKCRVRKWKELQLSSLLVMSAVAMVFATEREI